MRELDTRHLFYTGDALAVLKTLPSESVHCVVTSPPYWGLRDYGVSGQIGLERTPEEYVERLVEVFREARRVLRKDGTLWLNLGDSYNGRGGAGGDYNPSGLRDGQPRYPGRKARALKPKDLVGIPWMVAFALRADGWWLRDDVIWAKGTSVGMRWGNPMPESAQDRPARAHEYVFMLAKSEQYYYDDDAVSEPALSGDPNPPMGSASVRAGTLFPHPHALARKMAKVPSGWDTDPGSHGSFHREGRSSASRYREPKRDPSGMTGKLRDVWAIPPQPFPEAHFATFPEALVKPCILAGTSEFGCCSVCGAPYERLVERKKSRVEGRRSKAYNPGAVRRLDLPERPGGFVGASAATVGWRSTCDCNAEVMPCTVLDPFGGSGTVSLVAKRIGRSSIYIDLNPRYCEMAVRRCGPWDQPRLDGEDTYEVIDLRMGEEAVP